LLLNIKPFTEAPEDVDRRIKGISLLKGLSNNLRDASAEILQLAILPIQKIQTIQNLVDEANLVVLELEEIIERYLKKPLQVNNNCLKVHRMTWLITANEVEKLRRRLQDLHISVSVKLGMLNM
jgi:hypothetical protein